MAPKNLEPLVALGFTALESEIYALLLEESPATGYRVAQSLRKPASNIYKAIESLQAKGAVMVDEGRNRLCRPVPPEELLRALERNFRARRDEAEELLSEFDAPARDDRVYQLRSTDQVLERARSMLTRVQEDALVDVFPRPLELLTPDLEAAGERGVSVAIKAYREADVANCRLWVEPRGNSVLARWPGHWINLVVDGSEHLIALLSPDLKRVLQAVWTGSAYLSYVYHACIASELMLTALDRRILEIDDVDELRRELEALRNLKALKSPGYRQLLRRFGEPDVSPPEPGDETC